MFQMIKTCDSPVTWINPNHIIAAVEKEYEQDYVKLVLTDGRIMYLTRSDWDKLIGTDDAMS